jgi:hypothetical protein
MIAELPGLELETGGEGGLRFHRDPETGAWTVEVRPIYRTTTNAAEVRDFALACRDALAAAPGEHDTDVFFDGTHDCMLLFEIADDGTLDLDLVLNIYGPVCWTAHDYDRAPVHRMIDALLAATA